MADPGPTVARDPEDLDAPLAGEPGDLPAASADLPVPAPAAADDPVPEAAPPSADEAGTSTTSEVPPVVAAEGPVDTAADVPAVSGVSVEKVPAPVADQPPVTADGHDEGDAVQDDADDGEAEDLHSDDGSNDDDDGAEGAKPRGGLLTKQVSLDARTILVVVAVLALGVGAYLLGQRQGKDVRSAPKVAASTTPSSTAFKVPKDFVPFEDKDTGVRLAVPKEWAQYSTKDLDRSYRLLLGVPDAKDNLRVRVNAYSSEVTQATLDDQKAVIDAIFSQEKIALLLDKKIEGGLNGLPALFYVYKFTDAGGEAGYHAHFFIFQGRKMVSLVFEAVPEARYAQLAPVFDMIANSIEVAPGPPPAYLEALAGGTGTTLPGATTVPTTAAPPTSR